MEHRIGWWVRASSQLLLLDFFAQPLHAPRRFPSLTSAPHTTFTAQRCRAMETTLADEDAAARRVTLDLSFKNQHHVLTLPASTLLRDIQALAEAKTGIAPAHQKLIHKGKTLTDPTVTLGQLGGEMGTLVKLVLIGTTAAALAALADAPKQVGNVRIINDLGSTGGSGSRGMVPILRSRRYGFQRVDVLPHLPEQERARRLLTELASDPGVLHVMEKYQWSVGALCEMYPEGLVGVSSVCVMGTCSFFLVFCLLSPCLMSF